MSINQTMHQTLQELGEAFHTFKQVNDERLDALEHKSAFDRLQEDKLNRLQEVMDQTQTRLGQLQQLAKQRPTIDTSEHKGTTYDAKHKEAFISYIRCGAEEALRRAEQKSFNANSDSEGGYWMPQSMMQNLYSVLVVDSLLRSLTDMKEMNKGSGFDFFSDSKKQKVSWEQNKLRVPSEQNDYTPDIKKIHIPLCTMAHAPKVSQAMLEGAVHTESWLIEDAQQSMTLAENEAFLWGDPSKHEPEGILFHAKKEHSTMPRREVKKELPHDTNQAMRILLSMTSQLPTYFLREAVWLGSKEAMQWARSIKTEQGYLFWVPTKLDEPTSLAGRPFVLTDLMDKGEQNPGDIPLVFGNMKRGYQGIYREGIRVLRDPYTYKPHVELYITSQVGGAVIYPEAFCTLKINNA